VVFYAFRHTFKTLCRQAGISEEIHDALTGHVTGSVGRSYGQMPIEPLVRAVHSIKLPIRLPVLIAG
jgi:integrase